MWSKEFKLDLIDAIEKSVEKEKNILEIRLHETQLSVELIRTENKVLSNELNLKNTKIQKLEQDLETKTFNHIREFSSLESQNQILSQKLESLSSNEAIYKSHIDQMKSQMECIMKNSDKISNPDKVLVELLKSEISKKEQEIKQLQSEKLELENRVKDKETIKSSPNLLKSPMLQESSIYLDESSNGFDKKLKDMEINIKEKDDKIRIFTEEYQKKLPVLMDQKEKYEKLVMDHEEIKEKLRVEREKNEKLKEECEEMRLSMEEAVKKSQKNEKQMNFMYNQLTATLIEKEKSATDDKLEEIKEFVSNLTDYQMLLNEKQQEIDYLKAKVQKLESRPLVIEENPHLHVDFNRFRELEMVYQHKNQEFDDLRRKFQDLDEKNTMLQSKISAFQATESRNLEKIAYLNRELSLAQEKITEAERRASKAVEIIEIPSSIPIITADSTLQDYKNEIIRLKSFNSTIFEALKAGKTQIIELHNKYKAKIDSILNEKTTIYMEYKKLSVKYLDLESKIAKKKQNFSEKLKQKDLEMSSVNTKEFAAVSELCDAREQIKNLEENIKKLNESLELAKEESIIMHKKAADAMQNTVNKVLKDRLDDAIQVNNVLKYNVELLEEENRRILEENLKISQDSFELQKELNKEKEKPKIQSRASEIAFRAVESSISVYENKITQLISDLERKDKQIIALVSMIGFKDNVPQMMSKIVAALHKASKVLKT
ncbi:hypothetical protein SteCoe_30883 [Stentor coeruleus]|uniref:Uncharacterized protein n=1 Tax=Stentor coeruleus TaxID=5963 RepID=A0A1R2B2K0_9CILI|nr:hypothetical protein SteCoe_30883 [Stentor coeruleus]